MEVRDKLFINVEYYNITQTTLAGDLWVSISRILYQYARACASATNDNYLSSPSITLGVKRHFPRFLSGHGLAFR